MDGGILISYKVLCDGDFYSSITIEELLKNEKYSGSSKVNLPQGIEILILVLIRAIRLSN